MTQPFNPYYIKPSTAYAKPSGVNMGHINAGLQTASMLVSDVAEASQPAQKIQYSYDGNGMPSFDSAGSFAQVQNAQSQAKGGALNVVGDAAKYASAGAAFGPAGAAVGGVIGGVIGIGKRLAAKNRADEMENSLVQSTNQYNRDLVNYNSNTASNMVNERQRSKYASTNPYTLPSSAYWY